MLFYINIASQFLLPNKFRVVLPCELCEAREQNGIVQIDHPYGFFALTDEEFNRYVNNGCITIEMVS